MADNTAAAPSGSSSSNSNSNTNNSNNNNSNNNNSNNNNNNNNNSGGTAPRVSSPLKFSYLATQPSRPDGVRHPGGYVTYGKLGGQEAPLWDERAPGLGAAAFGWAAGDAAEKAAAAAAANEKVLQVEAKLAESGKRVDVLERVNKALREEVTELRAARPAAVQAEEGRVARQLIELRDRLVANEALRSGLEERLAGGDAELKGAVAQNHQLSQQLATAESHRQKMTATNMQLRVQLDALKKECTDYHNALAANEEKLQAFGKLLDDQASQLSEWERKSQDSQLAFNRLDEHIAEQSKTINDQQAEITKCKDEIRSLNESFEASQSALETSAEDSEKLETDLTATKAKLAEAEKALDEANITAENYRNEIDSLNAASEFFVEKELFDNCTLQLDSVRIEVEQLYRQKSEDDAEKQALQSRIQELEDQAVTHGAPRDSSLASELAGTRLPRGFTGSVENSPELTPLPDRLMSLASGILRRRRRQSVDLLTSDDHLGYFNRSRQARLFTEHPALQPDAFTMSPIHNIEIVSSNSQTPVISTSATAAPTGATTQLHSSEMGPRPQTPSAEMGPRPQTSPAEMGPRPQTPSAEMGPRPQTPPAKMGPRPQTSMVDMATQTHSSTSTPHTVATTSAATQTEGERTSVATETEGENNLAETSVTGTAASRAAPYLTLHTIIHSTPAAVAALLIALGIAFFLYSFGADYYAAATFRSTFDAANTLADLENVSVRAARDSGVIGVHWGVPSGGFAVVNTVAIPGAGLSASAFGRLVHYLYGEDALDKVLFSIGMWLNNGPFGPMLLG